jgi:hypothetical protein
MRIDGRPIMSLAIRTLYKMRKMNPRHVLLLLLVHLQVVVVVVIAFFRPWILLLVAMGGWGSSFPSSKGIIYHTRWPTNDVTKSDYLIDIVYFYLLVGGREDHWPLLCVAGTKKDFPKNDTFTGMAVSVKKMKSQIPDS